MNHIKTYESFQLGEEVWLLMNDTEEYVYCDYKKIDDDGKVVSGAMPQSYNHIFRPIGEADINGIRQFTYTKEEYALKEIENLFKSHSRLSDNRKNITQYTESVIILFNDGRHFNIGKDEMKPVKFFMGYTKPGSEEDYLNI